MITTSIATSRAQNVTKVVRSWRPDISDAGVLTKYQNATPQAMQIASDSRIARHVTERRRFHSAMTCASVSIDA
jgi:hypothetical protein